MTRPITVLIAEDEVLLRGSLAAVIENEQDLKVVAQADTGQEAVELARLHSPDVVLMDIRMPGLNGLDATRAITAQPALARTRVLILTMFELDEYVQAALRAGAAGFLLKDSPPRQLIGAVRRVVDGERAFATSVLEKMTKAYLEKVPAAIDPDEARLTPREKQVLALVARGMSNTEIAGDLGISMGTLKTHIGNLLMKLRARDRSQLVIAAYRLGLAN